MRALATLGAAGLLVTVVAAQAPVPNPTNKTGVIGLMHAIHSTNDIEKTLAFYQDVFVLNGRVNNFDPKGPRILTNSPTATLRVAMTNAAFQDKGHGREAAMRVPAHPGAAGKILRRRVVKQDERVEIGKLLGRKRLPHGKRPHLVSGRKDDLGNGPMTHAVMTRSRT